MENTNDQPKQFQAAEIQLSYKSNVKPSLRPRISVSRDACEVLRQSWDESKLELVEQFKVLFTNRANKVLGIMEVSTGGIAGTVVDPRLVFVAALKAAASGIILCHNHPSGNLKPSQADIDLTRKIKEGSLGCTFSILANLIIVESLGSLCPFSYFEILLSFKSD